MIAKVIVRKTGGNGFKRLAAYVFNERNGGRADPVDWKLADYILDHGQPTEKVAYHRVSNCVSVDPGCAVKECLILGARNTRSTKDKSYHLVVSFPVGERPTVEQMADIEDTLVAAAGYADHKRISAVHQNTDNWHLHVAVCTVHPTTLRNVSPYRDHFRLQEACQALEIKHGLVQTRHTPSHGQSKGGPSIQSQGGRATFARWVMENAAVPLTVAVAHARTWSEVHAASARYGVMIKPHGAGLSVVNNTNPRNAMKASAIDRSLSFKALTDRLGDYEPPGTLKEAPIMHYAGQPHDAEPSLWERYERERERAIAARNSAMVELRAEHMQQFNELNAWHIQRLANAKAAHLNRGDSISTHRVLDSDRNADNRARKAREAEERAALRERHQIPTWDGFLTRAAAGGDRAALRTLQRRVDALVPTGVIIDQDTRGDLRGDRDGGRV